MRCSECEANGAEQARYCSCCGRPVETASTASAAEGDLAQDGASGDPSDVPSPPEEAGCDACGVAIDPGRSLCDACERVFGRFLQPSANEVPESATLFAVVPEPDQDGEDLDTPDALDNRGETGLDVVDEPVMAATEAGSEAPILAEIDETWEGDVPDVEETLAVLAQRTVVEGEPAVAGTSATTEDREEEEEEEETEADPPLGFADALDAMDASEAHPPAADATSSFDPQQAEVAAPVFRMAPAFTPAPLIEVSADPDAAAADPADLAAEPDEAASDEGVSSPAPWWQARRAGAAESAATSAAPETHEEDPAPVAVVPPAPPPPVIEDDGRPLAAEPEGHRPAPSEAPRPAVGPRRPAPRRAGTSRSSSRQIGALVVAAAALVVAIATGAPSVTSWLSSGRSDAAGVPPISRAELEAAVAALQEQSLAPAEPAAAPTTTPVAKAAPTPAPPSANATPAKAPAKKPTPTRPAARRRPVTPTPPRQEPAVAAAEPTDAAPAPIAAVALAVPAGPSGAAMAPEVIESVPAGAAYEVTQVDSRPLVASQVAARLPDHLRERRFEEALVLRVLVTPSGRASDVRVLRRSRIDAALDAAAVAAVKQWRFSPATRRGQTVACWVSVGVPLRGDGTAGTQQ